MYVLYMGFPAKNGREVNVAIEDIRDAFPEEFFCQLVQECLDIISELTTAAI